MIDKKISSATFAWKIQVGGLQSRSSILIDGDDVYVGTCGDQWNVRDGRDGVHCISLETGKERWFAPTLADVNEIAIAGANLIAPTDNGDVFILNRKDGTIRHIFSADSAVLGKPIVYRNLGGWSALLASINGTLYWLESGSAEMVHLGTVSGGLRANLAPLGYDAFLAASENGTIYKGKIVDGQLTSYPAIELPLTKYGSRPAFAAGPVIVGNKALFGFARDTYYNSTALICINYEQDEIVWISPEVNGNLGNIRTTPIFLDGVIVCASAYSASLQLLDPVTGMLMDEILLGQEVFQQWSSPVPVGTHHVALGRVDGVCSIVDIRTKKLVSSVSLATAETEQPISLYTEQYSDEAVALFPGQPAPAGAICATPAFNNNTLIVGTTDGKLAAISLNLPSSRPH